MPEFLSDDAKNLLSGLLNKDPIQRLGSECISDVKYHPWCASVHWKKISKKKINPPFTPNYENSNFDEEFTSIPVNFDNFLSQRFFPDPEDLFADFDNKFDENIENSGIVDFSIETNERIPSVRSSTNNSFVKNFCVDEVKINENFGEEVESSNFFEIEQSAARVPLKNTSPKRSDKDFSFARRVKNGTKPDILADLCSFPAGMSKMKAKLQKVLRKTEK